MHNKTVNTDKPLSTFTLEELLVTHNSSHRAEILAQAKNRRAKCRIYLEVPIVL
jgi:hypothetical protein